MRDLVLFEKSNILKKKVKKIIPGGAHTYSKGDDQFPELSPGFIARGKGSKVWDIDGNEYIDWGMGLRSVILGHAFEPVLEEVKKTLELGVNFTRPSTLEYEVAEILVDLIPSAEMVKFAKNGSDVTTAAVRLARAYTGRNIVLRCKEQPFFSVDDWFIGDTVVDAGIPDEMKNLTKNFKYNDIEDFKRMLSEYENQIACVILEPASTEHPIDGFLQQIRALTIEKNIVLIFDEMISGFRWDVAGAQKYYNVTPDLSTFGKAIANGFSFSALVGKKEIMQLGGIDHDQPRVFLLSSTNGGETHSLAAAKATISFIKDNNVNELLWDTGRQLIKGFNEIAKDLGIEKYVKMQGIECSPYQLFLNEAGEADFTLRTLYLQEMIKNGVLIPYIAPSYAHSQEDIAKTLEASRSALEVLKKAIEQKNIHELLIGDPVKPVFRKYC